MRLRATLPTSFDARVKWPSCIHPVRDQGYCGSCWAFASAAFLEDRFCIQSNGDVDVVLSPEDMVRCDFQNQGCNGGWLSTSVNFLLNKGIVSDDCMPYESYYGKAGYCMYRCADKSTKYKKYGCKFNSLKLKTNREDIQKELMTNGPMMVGFMVYEDFMSYKSGVYEVTTDVISGGHAVKLIGWDIDVNGDFYWICQNQWGTSWGDGGFFNIKEGEAGLDVLAIACDPEF